MTNKAKTAALFHTDRECFATYLLIEDGVETVIRLKPCDLGTNYGWNVVAVEVNGDDWREMSAEQITKWRTTHGPWQPAPAEDVERLLRLAAA